MFLVATNVVASRPPDRQPTATSTARANKDNLKNDDNLDYQACLSLAQLCPILY